ncbi:MAG: aminotransferase class III-fold pyridoxal phosphate-dependent enzyme [Clostridia bacterium]|nr:aminotransferase class III-fold pyridoxal phosphate-dependent enzyme [Clostridia bacterium]
MFEKSQELFRKSLSFIGDARDDLDTAYPFFISKGKGAYVWDIDGNEYIDFTNANGGIVLGYCNEDVDNAVIDQIKNYGNVFATQYSKKKVELASTLLEVFPNLERVVLFKTGSDATDAAIRIARMATGKDIILTSGYHGWHDWQLNMFERFRFSDERHINFRYDLDLLRNQIEKYKGQIAGVIVTPEYNYYDDAFFIELQKIVKDNNLVFILDEVASGFRFCLGGLQKKIGLDPDITCLGKGLANGYSIAAVVGKNSVMKEACLKTHMWSTYNSELVGIVASQKTLEIMKKYNVPALIEEQSKYFAEKLKSLFNEFGITGELFTHPNIFHIVFEDDELLGKFVLECAKKGVLLSKDYENMLSLGHTREIVDNALSKIHSALEALKTNGDIKEDSGKRTLSRQALEARMTEEFDGNFEYSIFKDRK